MLVKKTVKEILLEHKQNSKPYQSNLMDTDYKKYPVRKNLLDYFKIPPTYVIEISKNLGDQIINFDRLRQFEVLTHNHLKDIDHKNNLPTEKLTNPKDSNEADVEFAKLVTKYLCSASLIYLKKFDTLDFDKNLAETLNLLESITTFIEKDNYKKEQVYAIHSFDLKNTVAVNRIHELGKLLNEHHQYYPANQTDDRLNLEDEIVDDFIKGPNR